ncbi:hypothetical protein [Ruegeria sp. HKCCD8929]|uniref:hypothetical protein n=1 Tax=Ruegeria sp. HKCCD8929 TaxID=2683006 RepID=UPI00148996B7|nr:hypothetical protein [Ruegeria sp. HKCCD8929]
MSYDADHAMQQMHLEAVKEQTIRLLQTDADWKRFRSNLTSAQKQIDDEKQSYKDEYAQRVSKAYQELQRKAGAKTYDYPTPFGTDRFNKDRNQQQAHKMARHEHAQRLYRIREAEIAGYESLGEDIRTRGRLKDHAHDDFARAVDRRDGQDRRVSGPER